MPSRLWVAVFVCLLAVVVIVLFPFVHPPPSIDEDGYFGESEPRADSVEVVGYSIKVEQGEVERLSSLMVPRGEGIVRKLTQAFREYDWNQHQYFLNTFKHFRTELEGLQIHFVRANTHDKDVQVVPLLIVPGLFSSFWNYFKLIPILSNPKRFGFDFGVRRRVVFDVIVPSLPGTFFSSKPSSDISQPETARILHKLMARLGIFEYFVVGGESVGADIASLIASLYPHAVHGLVVVDPFLSSSGSFLDNIRRSVLPDDPELPSKLLETSLPFRLKELSKEDPVSVLEEVVRLWGYLSGQHKSIEQQFTYDELLTETSLLWLTDSWLPPLSIPPHACHSSVDVPSAILSSPHSPWHFSRSLLSYKYHNITSYVILNKGGVMNPLQNAADVAKEIFSFVELVLS